MMFRDRDEAGQKLADEVVPLISGRCVVAGVPRGGVVVARPIADRLRAPLTVVYARKLTAPFAPELAFGAMDEDGRMTADPGTVAALGLDPSDIEKAKVGVWEEIRRRMALYGTPALANYLPGAAVVLVDDGLATGLTMRAALLYARRHGATDVTVATPCAAAAAADRFRRAADRFVSLVVDAGFTAVGQYYRDFAPVSDEQVVAMLARDGRQAGHADPRHGGLRVSFKSSRGTELSGVLLVPEGPGPHPVVVVAHGRAGGTDSPRHRATAETLRAAGFAAFLFDFTGRGEPEGRLAESTLGPQLGDDLGAVLDLLEDLDEVDAGRLGVLGVGSGAAVALRRAAIDTRVRALVLSSPNLEGAEAAAPRVTMPTLLLVREPDQPTRAASEALLQRLGGPRRLVVVPAGAPPSEGFLAGSEGEGVVTRWLEEHLGRDPRAAS